MAGPRVLVLGAGFGGLELATSLSEALGEAADVTVIDKNDGFVFGYSKLDVMFHLADPNSVHLPYREFLKPGVRMLREEILHIDPAAKRVTTNAGSHEADILVVALGADYYDTAVPGLTLGLNEFYSFAGAKKLRETLAAFEGGRIVLGVCGTPFKCPPAPSECALMLHDYLVKRGVRDKTEITLVFPLVTPIPPSPEASRSLLEAFAEREIRFIADICITAIDPERRTVSLDDGSALPCDLFLGVPKHRAPAVVRASELAVGDWVPVDPRTLETRFPGVYAVGDCASIGIPKAGVFAEGAARCLASALIAKVRGEGETDPHCGKGTCYIEYGGGRIGKVEIDFLSGPSVVGTFFEPREDLRGQKIDFGASRRARWFGLE